MTGAEFVDYMATKAWEEGPPIRIGRKRKPFVKSEMGLTTHRLHRVIYNDRYRSEYAVFECGDGTFYPHYLDAPPRRPRLRICAKCPK